MPECAALVQPLIDRLKLVTPGDEVCRLFHGRGGTLAGFEQLTVDWYPPVLLVTAFKSQTPGLIEDLQQELSGLWEDIWKFDGEMNLVFQQRGREGARTEVLSGAVPETHYVQEHGCKYVVHLLRGQNHGLFLDMRNGRKWVQSNAKERKVLNLFSYTCAFSVAAMTGGADETVNIDMSKGALATGRQNHQLNGIDAGVRLLGHDIFKSWGKLRKLGPYDLVIADPPSHQKGSFVATKDYARLLRKLPELITAGGDVLLCLNAPELSRKFLMDQVAAECPGLQFIQQLDNPEIFEDIDPDRALKVLLYRRESRL
ncbi:class I SAM-dependent methyltransferase [Sansalvadorimonas sp. 2012CJ34-2]|uniref:Class I SAM-dependent methyltransferase n=1 Tax=Parendozoicomonas callyspongiae TaxID=2942213 RepID=A0ABT0PIJ7_9GAMM|nr:class I SAM-dependent methyltransferase [Sansalvadorimonas sp. 2012CJ34-2]MCL6271220.1 class I SAM-dependent methyltransferase [Sansalvadorimonas sp. 2012CJ34-2]